MRANHQVHRQYSKRQTKEQIKGVNKIALYIDHKDTGIHELADTYSSAWVKGKDIISFDAFGCDEKTFSANGMNFKKLWESYWTQYMKDMRILK